MIHRADYYQVLLKEAKRLVAKICLDCAVLKIDFESPSVLLDNGENICADVITGADDEFYPRAVTL